MAIGQLTENKVLSIVKEHWKDANIQGVSVFRTERFVEGTIYFVSIIDANGVEHENYVYVTDDGLRRFSDMEQLVLGIGVTKPKVDRLQSLIETTGISGFIALLITATICFVAVSGRTVNADIFKALSTALSLILGFYFGSIHKGQPAKGQ